ncbi:MAG: beta-lactamase family protein [Rhizobiales bacterium]|nr:beta-lactamase family protein [Hyphomicrobiales bacterium]MBO6700592.1 beta-lactamase family protein [Hyphomicrobiales bacterium]MBO6738128.1 beta-lactamase family protein [Hyphomicrobiales bacterium]MBO6913565.1 beta-lactamase family protein [Hyphomicrobiales bacterium]MBO6955266.1 beta-lactamase family protein [Hyphomicrobiales bacterium]
MSRVAMRSLSLAFAVFLAWTHALADDQQAQIQALLDHFQSDYGFPGATAAIAWPDGRVDSVATGVADRETGLPMTPASRMLAASIGKSFVAATVLALESIGVLERDAPVIDHLGDRDWFARLPNHDTMTIHNLLRHSSGLPDHVHTDAFAAQMAKNVATGQGAPTPEEAIIFVLDTDPLFPSGAGWAYSDTGYLLLGLIIEQVSARSYYDLVSEHFIVPLALTETAPSNRRALPALVAGYTAQTNAFGLPVRTMDDNGRLLWDPAVEWTGGGLVSTSRDLAIWGHALFGGRAMATPYLERLLDGFEISRGPPNVLYGAGVAIYNDTPRGNVYGHGGWVPGYASSLRHYADLDVTIAFQINTDVGIVDDSTDLVPALEEALAVLAEQRIN